MNESHSKKRQDLSARRVKDVMKITREVVRGLAAEEKSDNGIIRRKVAEIMYRHDLGLPEKEREEVIRFARKRLVRDFDFGAKNIPSCIDALHAAKPEDSEIAHVIGREFNVLSTGKILDTIKGIRNAVDAQYKKDPDITGKEALRKAGAAFRDSVSVRIMSLMKLHEEGTGEIAQGSASKSGAAYILACSRLKQDWNRPDDTRKISNSSGEASEYSFESHIVEHELLREIMQYKRVLVDGRLSKPFLHISIHGCAKHRGGSDIFIANGVKDGGKLPCDPAIAHWFEEKIKLHLGQYEQVRGKKLKTHVSIEGQRLSGSTASVRRRWGLKGVTTGWGSMFQYVQLELSPYIRRVMRKDIALALAKTVQDFRSEFGSKTSLSKYISQNSSLIDRTREQGALYFHYLSTGKHIKPLEIQMNSDCRKMLGVRIGDSVEISSVDGERLSKAVKLTVRPAHYKNRNRVRPRVSAKGAITKNVLIKLAKK